MRRYFRIGFWFLVAVATFTGLSALAAPHFSWQGWAAISGFFGVVGFFGAGFMLRTAQDTRRDRVCLRSLVRGDAPRDGARVAVEGAVKVRREPLVAPMSLVACAAYAYQIMERVTRPGSSSGSSSTSRKIRYEGYHLVPSVIESRSGEVALLAFPRLAHMEVKADEERARALAASLADATPKLGPLERFARLDGMESDESGQVAVDWHHSDVRDWGRVELSEHALPVGKPVCVIGTWDAQATAIKPARANRSGVNVYPGTAHEILEHLSAGLRQTLLAAGVMAAVGVVAVGIPQAIGYPRTPAEIEAEGEAAAQQDAEAARRADMEAHLDRTVASGDLDQAFNLAFQEGNWAIARILDHGADPNHHIDSGFGHWTLPLSLCHGAEAARLLLAAGADPELAASDGRSGLHAAAQSGDAEWVGALLAAGAAPDAMAPGGTTPLDEAVRGGHVAPVRRLVAAGATAGCRDDGQCPLTIAARLGNAEMVAALLELGAAAAGSASSNPIEAARENGFDEIVRLLEAAR